MIAFYRFHGLRPRDESIRDSLTAWVKKHRESIHKAEALIAHSRECLDWAQGEIKRLRDSGHEDFQ